MPIFFIQSRYTVPHTDIITPLAKYYDILGREDLPPKLSFSEGIRYIMPEMDGCMVVFNPSDQKDEELLDAIKNWY